MATDPVWMDPVWTDRAEGSASAGPTSLKVALWPDATSVGSGSASAPMDGPFPASQLPRAPGVRGPSPRDETPRAPAAPSDATHAAAHARDASEPRTATGWPPVAELLRLDGNPHVNISQWSTHAAGLGFLGGFLLVLVGRSEL